MAAPGGQVSASDAPPEHLPGADGSEVAQHFIDGQWLDSVVGEEAEIADPATGERVGRTTIGGPEDALAALEAADRAFPSWALSPPEKRAGVLRAAARLVRDRIRGISRLLTLEQGKPFPDARKEVAFSADTIDYYADLCTEIGPEERETTDPRFRSLVLRQPVGVVAGIAPWNYPVELLVWKIAPALAAGCTVAAKPPPETPFAISSVIRCFEEAGLPPGVLSTVIGGGDVGEELVTNPISRAVKITASTATGKRVMELSARHLKRLTLELGGQTPMIVLEDADLAKVVPAAVRRSFSNMGQVCIGLNRVLVAERVADEFLEATAEQTRGLRLGHGLAPGVGYGPLTTEAVRGRVARHVEDAIDSGARLIVGGGPPDGSMFERGRFYQPTVIAEASPEMLIMREETFGPAVAVARVRSDDEVVELANASPYGLAAYVFGGDPERCMSIAQRLEFGGVGINVNDVTELRAPFGGWKESGIGRELGPEGMEACFELKHVRIAVDNGTSGQRISGLRT
jgi:succinate-semialdehyde dehydrogenase/glutarate-semialdehyde dehydrogenase